jgi:hypothetical protein
MPVVVREVVQLGLEFAIDADAFDALRPGALLDCSAS